MKSLQESLLDDVDKQVERTLRTVKIKPVWDPIAYVCYNYSWRQVFEQLCEIFNDDDSETQDIINIKIALRVYKETLWPMYLDIKNEDEYVIDAYEDDASEWEVVKDDCEGTKMWIDSIIETAELIENGDRNHDYVFSPYSSGSMLEGMDSPEGIFDWCTQHRSMCREYTNKYTKLIRSELSKFGIEL